MKFISEHAGDILIILVCIAILVAVVFALKEPIGTFFSDMFSKMSTLGGNVLDKIPTVGTASGIGGLLTSALPIVR